MYGVMLLFFFFFVSILLIFPAHGERESPLAHPLVCFVLFCFVLFPLPLTFLSLDGRQEWGETHTGASSEHSAVLSYHA